MDTGDLVKGGHIERGVSSRWHYPMIQGRVSRELPAKNHPWSDLGDSVCYLVAGAAPTREVRPRSPEDQHAKVGFDRLGRLGGTRRESPRATSPFSPFERRNT